MGEEWESSVGAPQVGKQVIVSPTDNVGASVRLLRLDGVLQ